MPANPANWRQHPDAQNSALRGSLREFGWAGALLYNEATGRLIDGHARKDVAADGGAPVPVLVGSWTEEQERGILVTLDPIAAMAEADAAMLKDLLASIPPDDDFEALRDELARVAKEAAKEEHKQTAGVPPKDERAQQLAKLWGTARGQLWEVGPHRLMCGDSTDANDVARLFHGHEHQAVMMFTDPPYLVDYTGNDRPHGSKDWSDDYLEVDAKDAHIFYDGFIGAALEAVLVDNAAHYIWHAHKHASTIEAIWQARGILNHQQIIWVKNKIIATYAIWQWRHEPCLFGWRKGFKPPVDGDNTKASSTVWDVDWEDWEEPSERMHPTQKPCELFARPMRKHTQPGDIVYEPFSGSGSQMVAAHMLDRRCFGMELSPPFVAVILDRMQRMGIEATLIQP